MSRRYASRFAAAADIAERLGLDSTAVYNALGMLPLSYLDVPDQDRMLRLVWDWVTEGIEWPFGDQDVNEWPEGGAS